MMQQMWKSFPRDLERKLNDLLDEAVPNSSKAFQLYKSCQAENLWNQSFETFSQRLSEFCAVPRRQRSKSRFDQFLSRPMDRSIYDGFHLTYRTALIEPTSVRNIASWAHHLMRLNTRIDEVAISITAIEKTINKLTNPGIHDKDSDLEFFDFCEAWRSVAASIIGDKNKFVINSLVNDLKILDRASKEAKPAQNTLPTIDRSFIYLTQTETEWIKNVYRAAFTYAAIPRYPLAKGPDKLELIEIQKLVTLSCLIEKSDRFEIVQHFESVRLTILVRCDRLFYETAA